MADLALIPPQVAPMTVAPGLVPVWVLLALEHPSLMSPLQAPMAVALGLVPVWYPKMASLALMPPQVAPMAVALGLVPALACCRVCPPCTLFSPPTSRILRLNCL